MTVVSGDSGEVLTAAREPSPPRRLSGEPCHVVQFCAAQKWGAWATSAARAVGLQCSSGNRCGVAPRCRSVSPAGLVGGGGSVNTKYRRLLNSTGSNCAHLRTFIKTQTALGVPGCPVCGFGSRDRKRFSFRRTVGNPRRQRADRVLPRGSVEGTRASADFGTHPGVLEPTPGEGRGTAVRFLGSPELSSDCRPPGAGSPKPRAVLSRVGCSALQGRAQSTQGSWG